MSVAGSALEGRVLHYRSDLPLPSVVLPLAARRFLHQLGQETFLSFKQLGVVLDALVAAPAFISRRMRWSILGSAPSLPSCGPTLSPVE